MSPSEAKRLTDAMLEFDPSDDYHASDLDARSYYAAVERCVRLVSGEIKDWQSPRGADLNVGPTASPGHT